MMIMTKMILANSSFEMQCNKTYEDWCYYVSKAPQLHLDFALLQTFITSHELIYNIKLFDIRMMTRVRVCDDQSKAILTKRSSSKGESPKNYEVAPNTSR